MGRLRHALTAVAAAAAIALVSCTPRTQPTGGVRPHTALDEHATALRAAFNADWGHVRVLVIVSPT